MTTDGLYTYTKRQKLGQESSEMEYEIIFNEGKKQLFKCNVCQKCCDTVKQFNIHKTSKKHVQNLERSKLIHQYSPEKLSSVDSSLSLKLATLLNPSIISNFIVCQLCNKSMNTKEQYTLHCNGIKHKRKLQSLDIIDGVGTSENAEANVDNNLKYCNICQIRIHINNMESHYKGKVHKEKMLKSTHLVEGSNLKNSISSEKLSIIQNLDMSDIYPKKNNLSEKSLSVNELKLTPRKYQSEVYRKSLNKDCVIFLPTGTGKTFVASMLILRMLEENPYHRVAFLVDKVLLVMQQHDFLKDQFEDISLERFSQGGSVSNRKLRLVGLANSYSDTTEDGFCVRDHDVVVATADLFRGLLANKQLLWENFSLVIFDEAHHCVKDHPYNKLLREYHLYPERVFVKRSAFYSSRQLFIPRINENYMEDWKRRRCKIIGLTASPAGDLDQDKTYSLLSDLLESLGDVDIVNVTENKSELELFISNSSIETKLVDYSKEESNLRKIMINKFFDMVEILRRCLNGSNGYYDAPDFVDLSPQDVWYYINDLENSLQNVEYVHKEHIEHMLNILEIIDAVDTLGYEVAWHKLKSLHEKYDEKVTTKKSSSRNSAQIDKIIAGSYDKGSTVVQAIIDEIRSFDGDSRTVLVLVKERAAAHKLERILRNQCMKQELILLVGHGTNTSKGKKDKQGMSVGKQKKALNLIKSGQNQVIVATSVADEGIDLPECDLVILVNPPSSVQALVQIRGRARKRSSRLLMICRDQRSIDDLHHLQVKEGNIMAATERILAQVRL